MGLLTRCVQFGFALSFACLLGYPWFYTSPPQPLALTRPSAARSDDYVTINAWSGRVGNHLHQIAHALLFAKRIGFRTVRAPSRSTGIDGQDESWWRVQQVLDLPDELQVQLKPNLDARLPKDCPRLKSFRGTGGSYKAVWWREFCDNVSAQEYRSVVQENFRPILSEKLQACTADDESLGDDGLLTVHLRGDDLWPNAEEELDVTPVDLSDDETPVFQWAWQQPPCSMYGKIITDGNFKRIRVVTSPDRKNPCVGWLQRFVSENSIDLTVQSSDFWLWDMCYLLAARHLALSYSTFAEFSALLSRRVRTIYSRTEFMQGSMMNCHVWPEVSLSRYHVPVNGNSRGDYNSTYRGLNHWMLTYPAENITKYLPCP